MRAKSKASNDRLEGWFGHYGWTPFAYQRQAWDAYARGLSGIVHAPTGMGKTLSVWLGPVREWMEENPGGSAADEAPPLHVLWITPLRALATDTAESLAFPVRELGLPWVVEKRTGDSSATVKARQKNRLPTALVTTPESLSLLLSFPTAREQFASLRCVVVDEWHELMATKRGVQTELCLARLRQWLPGVRTWGLSATLGNLEQARDVLLGAGAAEGILIHGEQPKPVRIETLLPPRMDDFPWSGHLGLKLLEPALEEIEKAGSTLLFTNTRSQAELWFQGIAEARPQWQDRIALHHGSLDRAVRQQVEDGLREGSLKCVVCTSSLDLGVDFSPVDLVLQVGSPKGVARLLQRAGRSGHRPGATSRILCVPTHTFELVEFSAARLAADRHDIESREPLERPLDVLVQHLVTMALAGGFRAGEMLSEVRTAHAFRNLEPAEWQWCLDFVERGGPALQAYPQFQRLQEIDGVWRPTTDRVGQMHRMIVGTISSDAAMTVRYVRGATLGTVEESFISRMKPGDRFLFGGKVLELVRIKELVAEVRAATGRGEIVPRWMGGRLPLSNLLSDAVRERLDEARRSVFADDEMDRARPVLEVQTRLSSLPAPGELMIERTRTRDGHHLFVYPFAGRLVHEGLSTLVAHRLARRQPMSITTVCNDYGFELLSKKPLELDEDDWRALLSTEDLTEDLLECLNASEMARRQFRDIARIAGLIFQGYPGDRKSTRQLQTSTGLLYDVFRQFDPENLLLRQAQREVLEGQLELARLRSALERIGGWEIRSVQMRRLSPLSFPLWAERLREQLVSTEAWIDRVQDMIASLEKDLE